MASARRVGARIGPIRRHNDQFGDREFDVELQLRKHLVVGGGDRALADRGLAVGRHEDAVLGVERQYRRPLATVQSGVVGRHRLPDPGLVPGNCSLRHDTGTPFCGLARWPGQHHQRREDQGAFQAVMGCQATLQPLDQCGEASASRRCRLVGKSGNDISKFGTWAGLAGGYNLHRRPQISRCIWHRRHRFRTSTRWSYSPRSSRPTVFPRRRGDCKCRSRL